MHVNSKCFWVKQMFLSTKMRAVSSTSLVKSNIYWLVVLKLFRIIHAYFNFKMIILDLYFSYYINSLVYRYNFKINLDVSTTFFI